LYSAAGKLGVAPTQVYVGSRLKWRRLAGSRSILAYNSDVFLAQLAVGNVDNDPADELILYPFRKPPTVYELDGAAHTIPLATELSAIGTLMWDYDGDGVDDLMAEEYKNRTPVRGIYDYNGHLLATPPPDVLGRKYALADLNGDGIKEVVNREITQRHVAAIGRRGAAEGEIEVPTYSAWTAYGDSDGDGHAEALALAILDDTGIQLYAFGIGQDPVVYPAWMDFQVDRQYKLLPTTCYDLDGDGAVEVFAADQGYFNPATNQYVELKYPACNQRTSSDTGAEVQVADLDNDGSLEIITSDIWLESMRPGSAGLYIFDTQGNCKYYEELGDSIESWAIARDDQRQAHLVVKTENQLLVYP